MGIELERKHVSALAKLNFAELYNLSHMQRIDAIAQALGFEGNAALMGTLKKSEQGAAPAKAGEAAAPEAIVITAFGSGMTGAVGNMERIDADTDGDLVERRFASGAEAEAYMKGIEDMDGWMSYDAAAATGTRYYDANREFFEARAQSPELTFKEWHNARVAEFDAEFEDDGEDNEPDL